MTTSRNGSGEREDQSHRLRTTLQRLNHACSRLADFDRLTEDLAAVIADAVGASRLLVFLKSSEDGDFSYKYGIRPPSGVEDAEYEGGRDVPDWLERNPKAVSRSTLGLITDGDDRMSVEGALMETKADVLVPLYGKELVGWLCIGAKSIGGPYTDPDLADMFVFACYMATTLENALSQREDQGEED